MSNRINFSSMVENPIENHYDHIMNNLQKGIETIINNKIVENNIDYKLIEKYTNKINEERNHLDRRYKDDGILSRKVWNVIIIIFCCLIIGIFFLPVYFNNKKIIDSYKMYEFEKNKIIDENIEKRYSLFISTFSTLTMNEIYKGVFEYFGVDVKHCYNFSKIDQFIEKEDFAEYTSGFKGVYKNSLFYDFIAKYSYIEDVVTSRSESFAYEDYNYSSGSYGSNSTTKYETLTAYHHEPTPMDLYKNVLLVKTNFLKNLVVKNNQKKPKKKDYPLENIDFCNTVKIEYSSENQSDLMNFFTIKSQEDMLKWYQKRKYDVENFVKANDNFAVIKSDVDPYLYTIQNKQKSILSYIDKEEDNKIKDIAQKIFNDSYIFFERWASMMQLPLLIPGISREWYREDGKYLISNELDDYKINLENDEYEKIILLNRFSDDSFTQIDNYIMERDPWFTNECENHRIGKEEFDTVGLYAVNSYYSVEEIDYVTVYGFNVGTQVIAVPYERFYPISKLIYFGHIKLPKPIDEEYVIGPVMNRLINPYAYKVDYMKDIVQKFNIWTNKPIHFETSSKYKDVVIFIAKNFSKISQEFENKMTIKIDNTGISIFVDNVSAHDIDKHKKISLLIEKYAELLSEIK